MCSSLEELGLSVDAVRGSLWFGSRGGGWLITVFSSASILKEFIMVVWYVLP